MIQSPAGDPGRPRALRSIVPGFDPASVRCAAEAKLWAFVEKKEDFYKRLMALSTDSDAMLVRGNLDLRTDAYRVDPAITPALAELRDSLRNALRIVKPVDVYVRSSPELNAFCMPARKGTRFVMCLYSSLFQLCTASELLFVMGHEIGHALLGQTKIPKIPMGHPDFSQLEAMRISALSRRQELSCDRIGLLACQDLKAAGSALFKLMSGLPDSWTAFDENVLAKDFDNIVELAAASEMEDASTHPIIALRVKALLAFSQSKLYSDALALPAGSIATEDLERTTEYLLSTLEPDTTELENAPEEKAADFVVTNGALAVMAADGVVDSQEAQFIKKVLGGDANLVQALEQPDFSARTLLGMREPAAVLAKKLSANSRANSPLQDLYSRGAGRRLL